jgi:glycosyltransferase involved in cell wall biosynthesis
MINVPRISIITPSFNQAEFLERTIKSVLGQGYPNLEYIIIDGGSTDDSVDIIKKYEGRITFWVSEKDNGQAEAIKKGFDKAAGDIYAWLNSDDIYLPGTLTKISNIFQETTADIVYGDEYVIDKDDNIVGERLQLPFPYRFALPFMVYGGFCPYQPATFWKKSIHEKAGGIDTQFKFVIDPDLFARFILENANFVHIGEKLTSFRVHETSKTCTIQNVRKEERNILHEKYGNNVSIFLRSEFFTRKLGWLYQFRHIFRGDIGYFVKQILNRIGIKSTGNKLPY